MTASEPHEPRPAPAPAARSIADRALDTFVYLPAGVLVTALEDMPAMAARGRARLEQELRNAQLIGHLAVDYGWRQLKDQIDQVAGDRGAPPRPRPRPAAPARSGAGPRTSGTHTPAPAPPPAAPSGVPAEEGTAEATSGVDRAIPDYDILSASQVVRRLDGLGPAELRAVLVHERETRGRRTILHRVAQLLVAAGQSDGDGPPGRPSSPGRAPSS